MEKVDTLEHIASTLKEDITNVYTTLEKKGATMPTNKNIASLSETIDSINSTWKPQSDWYDIEKILDEDTEDYAGKMIVLLANVYDTIAFLRNGSSKNQNK